MRKDKARTIKNYKRETTVRRLVKEARDQKTPKALNLAFSALDKAAKVKLIHKNKANRLKSRLSKVLSGTKTTTTTTATTKSKKAK